MPPPAPVPHAAHKAIGTLSPATPTKNAQPTARAALLTPTSAQCTTQTLFSGGDQAANTLAVQTNGVPFWWGGSNPNPTQHGPANAIGVGDGLYNDYVISSDTSLWVWGMNNYGQYGNGTQSPLGIEQSYVYGAVGVATSGRHVVLLRNDGTVWTWGDNNGGELGNGGTSNLPSLTPGQLSLTGIVKVAAGGGDVGVPWSMALKSDGTVWVWGYNYTGQLGLGTTGNIYASPTQIPTLSGIVSIAASTDGYNSMALASDGTVWTWGANLGDGTTNSSNVPVHVPNLTGVAAISVSTTHAMVAKTDGTVWEWGDNRFGEMDNGTYGPTVPPVLSPLQANSISGATEVAAGDEYSEVLLSSGAVWGWGQNENYELGTGFMTVPYTHPVQPILLSAVAQPAPCPNLANGSGPAPGPAASEMLGGGPIDELAVAPNCCNGVTPAIGNFWHTSVDLGVPGRGVPLSFSRTYNSLLASQNGPLGFGWTDSYNVNVTFDGSGNPTVHEENGATIGFTLAGTTYQPPTRVLATFVKNGDGTYTLNRRFQVHLTFNSSGQLTKVTDRNGYATVLAYIGGQLTTVTDPANRTLTLSYTNGLLTKIIDTATPARSVVYGYDFVHSNLTSVTDVNGGLTSMTYDPLNPADHLFATLTDSRTNQVSDVIDPATGRVTMQTDAKNNATLFGYGTNSTSINYPAGSSVFQQFQNNALTAQTKGYLTAQGATWTYSYDSTSLGVTSATDPMGYTTNNTWYPSGYPHTSTDPLQHQVSYTYDGLNDVLTTTDALNVTTTQTYDGNGNSKTTSTPLVGTSQTQLVTNTYGDTTHPGDVTAVTDQDGKTWTLVYDTYGDRISASDPLSDKTTYCFDTVGRLSYSVAPKGNVACGQSSTYITSFGTNAFADPTYMQDPKNDNTQYFYDGNRNLTKVIDPQQNVTLLGYDANNRQTSVTSGSGSASVSTTSTAYDANGNVASVTDGLNHTTTYSYDALDHQRSATDPLGRVTRYEYDPTGRVTGVDSAKGTTTTYGYDAAGRLFAVYYSSGAPASVAFGLDADNQRISMTDGTGTSTYTIDSLHRVTKAINGGGQTVSYGYDLKGQLTSIVYPGGTHTVVRTYDPVGRLATVTDWLSHTTTYTYDADSNLIKELYPNGVTANLTPDQADRLMAITDTAKTQFLTLSYGRDGNNNLCNIGSASCSPGSMSPYDPLQRQTVAPGGSYGYDTAGNMTQIALSPYTTTLTFDAAEQISSKTKMNGNTLVQRLTYTFDPNGNRTQQVDQNNVATNFGYNQANQLIRYGTTSTYAYNGVGLRTSKTVSGVLESYVWNLAQSTSAPLVDGATDYVTGFRGQPLEQISGSTVYYYHQDQLGSTIDITNSRGSIVNTYTYDSYGGISSGLTTSCSPCGIVNPLQFAGQYVDSESGFEYLGARYYEPSTGLFLTKDRLARGTVSAYAYASGSPQNFTDPSGECTVGSGGSSWLIIGGYDVGQHLCNGGDAAADIRNVRPHGTFTFCENFQVQLGIGGGVASQCYAYSVGTGLSATTNTDGMGLGLGDSAMFGVSVNFYNTDRINDLGGLFYFQNAGVGVPADGVPLAGAVQSETNANGSVSGGGISFGVGVPGANYLQGGSFTDVHCTIGSVEGC